MNFNAPTNTNFDPGTGSAAPVDLRVLLAALGASQQQPLPGQPQTSLHQSSGSLSSIPQWPVQAQMPVGQYQWQQPQVQPGAAAFQAPLPQPPPPQLQPNAPLNQTQYNIIAQWAAQNQAAPQSAAPPIAATQQLQPNVVQNTDLNAVTASFLSAFNTYLTQQQQDSQAPPVVPQVTQQNAPVQTHRQVAPVGSAPDDESRLIAALRNRKSLNVSFRQALESLDGVNNHSAAAWKDYFLDHIHRLYAQSDPQRPKEPRSGDQAPTTQATGERYSIATPLEEGRVPRPHLSKEARPTLPRPSNVSSHSSTMTPPEFSRRSPDLSGNPPLGTRRRRGSPVAMYHAGTRIPLWSERLSVKPTPPTWEKNDGSKFTDADKTFFIHYIQWRMHNDPLITKPELYAELAEHAPHHDADAWKRHWDKWPQLPDKLFIEGRNRAYPPTQPSISRPAGVPRRTQKGPAYEDNGDSKSSSGESEDENADARAPDKQASSSAPSAGSSAKKGVAKSRKYYQAVTEADLRAMALYMFENQPMWSDPSVTITKRWTEFAEREGNTTRRTLLGWMSAEKAHATQLKAFVEELRKAAETEVQTLRASKPDSSAIQAVPLLFKQFRASSYSKEPIRAPSEKSGGGAYKPAKKRDSITPQETKSEEKAAARDVEKAKILVEDSSAIRSDAFEGSRKRHADEDTKVESPVRKRPKEGPQEGIHEVIELSD
ncbi:hypothetical protein C8Q73DRAFT_681533 [Cubamyces lactineus]|nr:hypothetical protein C8Q73DRAFT_681533 [Cubamyces lactineus]